ncbi:MAG: magnesium transporter [Candidatus Nanohaloarchaea archaeon]|nr:magnesium transporter [Candidatus Nanohaloarchaea archaeon]
MAEKHKYVHLARDIRQSPPEEAAEKLKAVDRETSINALREVDTRQVADIFEELSVETSADYLLELPPDDAADIIGALSHRFRIRLLNRIDKDEAEDIIELLQYPPDTAGGLMTTDFISFSPDTTVKEARDHLQENYADAETVYYAYVREDEQLVGTVSLKELTLASSSSELRDIMTTDLETLETDVDSEEVIRIFDRHHYQAMPVVEDSEMRGIITFDDVIDVMREEATEDVQKLAGGSGHEQVFSKWTYKVRKRVPWLYFNLIAAFLAAGVVALFEGTIAQVAILAAFLPILNNQAGNTGMQALSVTIRGQATGEMEYSRILTAVGKELVTGIVNGVLVGGAIGAITYFWQGSLLLGGVVAGAMILTIIVATMAGLLVPVLLEKTGNDPAMASSIFVTAVSDISGIFFLLILAQMYLV